MVVNKCEEAKLFQMSCVKGRLQTEYISSAIPYCGETLEKCMQYS